jgi:hypothetical protein
MIFRMGSTLYAGSSAIEIIRKIERDTTECLQEERTVRDFIAWSLLKLSDKLPLRELAVSDKVTDETLALSYLCLLDQYGLGELDTLSDAKRQSAVSITSRRRGHGAAQYFKSQI